jgi:ComF family protein
MWERILNLIGALLVPTRCQLCQRPGDRMVCEQCAALLEPVGVRYCLRCGRRRRTTFASPDCGECSSLNIGVVKTRSVYVYGDAGRKALAEFKFNGKPGVGRALCELALQQLPDTAEQMYDDPGFIPQLVIPVPLHRTRLRKRRFNQAALIAVFLAEHFGCRAADDGIFRIRETPTQVGLTAPQRWDNVRGAFKINEAQRELVANRNVIIVDDLMTTGATLAACARELRRAGSGLVYGFTLFSTVFDVEHQAGGRYGGAGIMAP